MKPLLVFSLLLMTLSSPASDVSVFAVLTKEDPATYRLIASPNEVKSVNIQKGDVIDIGNGPEQTAPIMTLEVAESVSSKIQDFAHHYNLKMVNLRVIAGEDSYDGLAFPEPMRNSSFASVLHIGIYPETKIKTEPNKTLQRMPMSVTPDASASAAPATGISDL